MIGTRGYTRKWNAVISTNRDAPSSASSSGRCLRPFHSERAKNAQTVDARDTQRAFGTLHRSRRQFRPYGGNKRASVGFFTDFEQKMTRGLRRFAIAFGAGLEVAHTP
jgi:hypothetical protein